jgi:hypothetical protein
MGLFLFTIEFDAKAPELSGVLKEFLASSEIKVEVSAVTKLSEEIDHCDLWIDPRYRTSIIRKNTEIEIEVMLGQPLDIAELFMDFLKNKGGKRVE